MGSGSVFAGINLCHLEVASPLSGPLLSPLTMKVLNKISSSLSEFAFQCGAPAELPQSSLQPWGKRTCLPSTLDLNLVPLRVVGPLFPIASQI